MAHLTDFDILLDLFGKPTHLLDDYDPDYRAVGIDDHFQVVAGFTYTFN